MEDEQINLNEISAFDGTPLRTDGPAFKDDEPVEVKEEESKEVTETQNEEQDPASSGESNNEDESRVPYSRFSQVLSAKKELADENEKLKSELEKLSQTSTSETTDTSSLPAWWVKMYGDDDASVDAYNNGWVQMTQEAKKLAIQELKQEQQRIAETTQKNEQVILDSIAQVESSIKRTLTEEEKRGLLLTVDEYTPKDANGVYTSDLFPFEKAWKIYSVENNVETQKKSDVKKEAQKRIAGLSSTNNDETPDGSSNQTEERVSWGQWRDNF